MWPPPKNTEFTLHFTLYRRDGTPIVNPGTITKKISIDGGAMADIAASVTEEDTTYGQLSLVFSAAEMNGDAIWFQIYDDTPDCQRITGTIYTGPTVPVETVANAIKDKTDNLPASPAAVGSAMTLATGAMSADALAADAVAEIWARAVEGSITAEQIMRAILAFVASLTAGGGTTNPRFRDQANSKNRIDMTVDENGNRSAVTLDLT